MGGTPEEKVTTTAETGTQQQTGTTSGTTSGTTTGSTAGTSAGTTTGITGGLTSGQTTGLTAGQTTGAGTSYGTTAGTTTADVPDWLLPFVQQATGTASTALNDLAAQTAAYTVPTQALDPLYATAGGDYLYGGPQQQAFVDAAVRAAQPTVYSAFGAAGRAGSGLEAASLDQAAIDAYASLYNDERNRQMSAATAIPGISLMPIQLQQQLASLAGGLPASMAPYLGASTLGTTTGATTDVGTNLGVTSGAQTGSNLGVTSGATTGQTTGTSDTSMTGTTTGTTDMTGTTSSTGTTTEPIDTLDPWLQAAAIASLGLGAASGLAPASAAATAAGGLSGGSIGGLLSLF